MSVLSKERLTERNEANTAYFFPLCFEKCNGFGASRKCDRCEVIHNVCEKLGEYEDLEDILRDKLTEEAVNVITASKKDFSEWLDRILWTNKKCDELARKVEQYRNLEEQGLLLRLPCKVGDTVYVICECEECNKFKTKQAVFEDKVEAFLFYEDGLSIITSNHPINSRIGGLVFLTQSEAEEKLRELEGK